MKKSRIIVTVTALVITAVFAAVGWWIPAAIVATLALITTIRRTRQ